LKAVDIIWDTDDYSNPDELDLPSEVEIPDNINENDVADYLSDLTGFCHKGYRLIGSS